MNLKNNYFLLRHGQTIYQTKRRDFLYSASENFKLGLTKEGKKQINKIAKSLKAKKIDLIFSSDFLRTSQSAEIIAKALSLKINFDKRLRDINLGIFQGGLKEKYKKFFAAKKEKFFRRPPKGESWNDVKKRMLDFLKKLEKKYKGSNILIISHGDPLWLLAGELRGFSQKDFLEKGRATYPEVGEIFQL